MSQEQRTHDDERPVRTEPDGGAFINNRGEAAVDSIPGDVNENDERVAGVDTQSSGAGAADERVQGRSDSWPHGHRQGDAASRDDLERKGDQGRR